MEHLKALRRSRGLTQKDLAQHLGIDRTTYVKYETGASEPSFHILAMLADYFGVSADYLLDRETDDVSDVEDIRVLSRSARRMTPEQLRHVVDYVRIAFPEAFDGGSEDK